MASQFTVILELTKFYSLMKQFLFLTELVNTKATIPLRDRPLFIEWGGSPVFMYGQKGGEGNS